MMLVGICSCSSKVLSIKDEKQICLSLPPTDEWLTTDGSGNIFPLSQITPGRKLINYADSAVITVQIQVRDLEYVSALVFNDNSFEEVFDSIKVKFRRLQNPPTGNTTVAITGYVTDFVGIAIRLKGDITAVTSNCASRVENVLRATGDQYLIGQLDNWDARQSNRFSTLRQFGRDKLRRTAPTK